uniref:histidine kinase n=1 Tax=Desulfovibrio sp. U5L TaxID=596152 RepID=I2Q5B1_9BACT
MSIVRIFSVLAGNPVARFFFGDERMRDMKTIWKLLLTFSVKLTLFLLLLAVCYRGLVKTIDTRQWVVHSYEAMEKTSSVYVDLLNIEAGLMRFAASGRESSLESLQRGLGALDVDMGSLAALMEDNPQQQRNVEMLRRQSRQWLETQVNPLLALRRQVSAGQAEDKAVREFLASGQGLQLFESMRATFLTLRQEERRLLEKRTEEMRDLQEFTEHAVAGGGAAVILVGLLLSVLMSLSITRPLERITAYARRIASGESSMLIDIWQKDEVGRLAGAFRDLQRSIIEKTSVAEAIAAGDLDRTVRLAGEHDTLGRSINRMTEALRETRRQSERTDWIKSGLNELSLRMRDETDPRGMAGRVLGFLTPYLGVQAAALYLRDGDGNLAFLAGYAAGKEAMAGLAAAPGDGLAARAAAEGTLVAVSGIPEGCLRVNAAFGDIEPRNILALPFSYQENLVGVLELGAFDAIPDQALEFLRRAAVSLAVTFDGLARQARVRGLLEQTQRQAVSLKKQQEELRASNEELEEHAQTLRRSEEELRLQQEELQSLNEELEEKNGALEKARRDVERKAADLETASRYKSEFLANMSHELRTPLNSLLLLARNLRDNGSGRLDPDEVEAAGIIYKNGNDLLMLINDILDLSKVEAGKLSLHLESVPLADVAGSILVDFGHVAEGKGISLRHEIEEGLPQAIRTDRRRLEQILRNLVSNAMKFTEKGGVVLRLHLPAMADGQPHPGGGAGPVVAFSVIDTGIGIAADKQQAIFEAFQQVDGTSSRRYGGTGLGLSITRELARLLGGRVTVESRPGRGSTFTFLVPIEAAAAGNPAWTRPEPRQETPCTVSEGTAEAPLPVPFIPDDRDLVRDGDRVILIIEDDPDFAAILRDLARGKGFRAVAAATGEEGLSLAERLCPLGVVLDLRLPGISGWTVLGALKRNHATRHIPVHIVSVHDAPRDAVNSQIMGAVGFLNKPVDGEELELAFEKIAAMNEKTVKDLLLVEDDPDLRRGIRRLVADLDVNVTEAGSGAKALDALAGRSFDCMILDLGLSDMCGFELLQRLEKDREVPVPPVIVYTGRDLTREEEMELYRHADSIIIKGARSEERLLDEVTLFLHRMVGTLSEPKQRMLLDLHNRDAVLEGKKVLVVDDDMRNLFALSKVLTEKGLRVLKADDGAKALEILRDEPDVDAVLMDIMMPGLDGYEALRRIREESRFADLPLIALTAKAMKEDRGKCLAAGANDYLAKPVDVDKLLSMLRVWLYGN